MSVNFAPLRVLIVEDHLFMRQVLRAILMGIGFQLIEDAPDGERALQILKEVKVDLAFVDYHLGGLDGAEFTRVLRTGSDSPAPFLPIIGLTADAQKSTIMRFINCGADEVLAKPVAAAAVWSRIHAIVQRRRSFVRGQAYFGPDRRRRIIDPADGVERRDVPAMPA